LTGWSNEQNGDLTRRLFRGFMLAILVGTISVGFSVAPALFIQSVFVGSAQRCEEQQRFEQAALDQVQTTCGEELGEAPFWFPVLVIAVGGGAGVAGGFGYGFFANPPSRRRAAWQAPNQHAPQESQRPGGIT
jgi:hypothetical protein